MTMHDEGAEPSAPRSRRTIPRRPRPSQYNDATPARSGNDSRPVPVQPPSSSTASANGNGRMPGYVSANNGMNRSAPAAFAPAQQREQTIPTVIPAGPASVSVTPTRLPRRRKRRVALPVLLALVVLCLLVGFGAIFSPHFFAGAEAQLTPTPAGHTGAFVQPQLSAAQINALHHLVSYMQ